MSEPQHIKEILPGVMLDIERRMERHKKNIRAEQTKKVVSATNDYFASHRPNPNKRPSKQKVGQGKLLF